MLKSEELSESVVVYEFKNTNNDGDDELNDALVETVYEKFRIGNEDLKIGTSGKLMFEVEIDAYQSRSSKRDASKQKRRIFVSTKDKTEFTQVLKDLAPYTHADASTSVFMTDDKYGIRPKQTAGSVFLKYGNKLTLMTGVHLSKVSWHRRS